MRNRDPLLTLEEFEKRLNSFHLHFVGEPGKHLIGDIYRKQKPYQRCMEEHREEFEPLVARLREMKFTKSKQEWPRRYLKLLYQAYKLMHPYAERDGHLFA